MDTYREVCMSGLLCSRDLPCGSTRCRTDAAEIAANRAADTPREALNRATERALTQPGAKWTPATGWTNDALCAERLSDRDGFEAICAVAYGIEHSHHDMTARQAVAAGTASPLKGA